MGFSDAGFEQIGEPLGAPRPSEGGDVKIVTINGVVLRHGAQ
jgi:hypothetical protein